MDGWSFLAGCFLGFFAGIVLVACLRFARERDDDWIDLTGSEMEEIDQLRLRGIPGDSATVMGEQEEESLRGENDGLRRRLTDRSFSG